VPRSETFVLLTINLVTLGKVPPFSHLKNRVDNDNRLQSCLKASQARGVVGQERPAHSGFGMKSLFSPSTSIQRP
jgi:hypothetical protein